MRGNIYSKQRCVLFFVSVPPSPLTPLPRGEGDVCFMLYAVRDVRFSATSGTSDSAAISATHWQSSCRFYRESSQRYRTRKNTFGSHEPCAAQGSNSSSVETPVPTSMHHVMSPDLMLVLLQGVSGTQGRCIALTVWSLKERNGLRRPVFRRCRTVLSRCKDCVWNGRLYDL